MTGGIEGRSTWLRLNASQSVDQRTAKFHVVAVWDRKEPCLPALQNDACTQVMSTTKITINLTQ